MKFEGNDARGAKSVKTYFDRAPEQCDNALKKLG